MRKFIKKTKEYHFNKPINVIVKEFNTHLSQLFLFAKKIEPNDDLRSYHNKFKLAKSFNPSLAIEKNKDDFWNNREFIMTRNKDYFLKVENFTSENEDEKECFKRNMVIGKTFFNNANTKDIEKVWSHLNAMLKLVIEYKALTNDYIIE